MIAESDVEVLRASVAGPVLTADDADYDAEAQCYNLAPSPPTRRDRRGHLRR